MKKLQAFVFFLAFLLSGCTSVDGVSIPKSFPAEPQYKLKAVAHWQMIAKDVAAQLKLALEKKEKMNVPVYLTVPDAPSVFERNFLPMLRSALLQEGLAVSTQIEGASQLQIMVDRVRHAPTYRAGTLTILGAGLLVARDAVTYNSTYLTNPGGAALALAADIAMAQHQPPPELELVLSLSLKHQGQYLASLTQTYYLSSEDQSIYAVPALVPPTGRVFEVKGGDR